MRNSTTSVGFEKKWIAQEGNGMSTSGKKAIPQEKVRAGDPYCNLIFALVNLTFLLTLFLILPAAGKHQSLVLLTMAVVTPDPSLAQVDQGGISAKTAYTAVLSEEEPVKKAFVPFTGINPYFTGIYHLITRWAFYTPFSDSNFGKN